MFGKGVYLYETKDFILRNIDHQNYEIEYDTKDCFCASIQVKKRKIQIKASSYKKGSVTIDVIDPFGMIRIPRESFKKREELEAFLLKAIKNIILERNM